MRRKPFPPAAGSMSGFSTMPPPPDLDEPAGRQPRQRATLAPLEGYTFEGFRNNDGSVGTRNILAITTTVQCVAGVVDHAVRRIKAELLPRFPNVDDVVGAASTPTAAALQSMRPARPSRSARCATSASIPTSAAPRWWSASVAKSCSRSACCRRDLPSATAAMMTRALRSGDLAGRKQRRIRLHDRLHHADGGGAARANLTRAAARPALPLDLVVGVQCGGSDAFSGVTANPAVGFAADLLVRAGATIMFSEVTEVRDGIDQLTARAVDADVAKALIREMDWYDQYLANGSVDRSANTTPGNKKGGLSNIVEKAMGSIVKSGSAPIAGVVPAGERARQKGLLFAATPASDFICGTLQLAAGMNIHVFTTGRGTPTGWPKFRSSRLRRGPIWRDDGMISWISTPAALPPERQASRTWAGSCFASFSRLPAAANERGRNNGACTMRSPCSIRVRSPDRADCRTLRAGEVAQFDLDAGRLHQRDAFVDLFPDQRVERRGVIGIGSMPCCASFSLTAGVVSAFCAS